MWMNLQVAYDLKITQQKHGAAIAKQVAPREDNPPTLQGDDE